MEQAIEERPAAKVTLRHDAEQMFRELWASVFYSGRTADKRVVVSSSVRREGASTIACGLALAGSHRAVGERVALVDFNLRAPSLHDTLGVKGQPGIAGIFSDGLDATDIAQHVNDGLDLYPAGRTNDRILPVLRSGKIGEFLDLLSENYDHVLVDVAPVCLYPDVRVLVSSLKEVLLVVKSGHTPRQAVALAKERLDTAGAKVIGLVLNQRSFSIPSFLYNRL